MVDLSARLASGSRELLLIVGGHGGCGDTCRSASRLLGTFLTSPLSPVVVACGRINGGGGRMG